MKTLFNDSNGLFLTSPRELNYKIHLQKSTQTGFNHFVNKFQTPIPL